MENFFYLPSAEVEKEEIGLSSSLLSFLPFSFFVAREKRERREREEKEPSAVNWLIKSMPPGYRGRRGERVGGMGDGATLAKREGKVC